MAFKLPKRVNAILYGVGAAVVIVGALFKLQHWPGANEFLIIGLLTEAAIFGISAFEPLEPDYHWENVYPQLVDEHAAPAKVNKAKSNDDGDAEGMLSKKLDAMLKEAKIDGQLMESLGNSIKNFEAASKTIAPTAESLASTKKYSDELTLAATQMESINALYKIQLDSASKTTQMNEEVAENSIKLNQQMQALTSNLSSLNNVYGGMLSAMSNK
jgi:gliding motility-associated protein GldL